MRAAGRSLTAVTLEQAPKSSRFGMQDLGAPTAPRIARRWTWARARSTAGTRHRAARVPGADWGRSEIDAFRGAGPCADRRAQRAARSRGDPGRGTRPPDPGRAALPGPGRPCATRAASNLSEPRGRVAFDPPALPWPVLPDPVGTPAVIGAFHKMRQAQPPAPSPRNVHGPSRRGRPAAPLPRGWARIEQPGADQAKPASTSRWSINCLDRAGSSAPADGLGAGPQPPAALGAAGPHAMAHALAPSHHQPGARWQAESERLDCQPRPPLEAPPCPPPPAPQRPLAPGTDVVRLALAAYYCRPTPSKTPTPSRLGVW